jgi:hypothetical protein
VPATRLGAGDAAAVDVGGPEDGSGDGCGEGVAADGVAAEVADDEPGESPGLAEPPALPPEQAAASAVSVAARTATTRGEVAIPQSAAWSGRRARLAALSERFASVRAWPTSS